MKCRIVKMRKAGVALPKRDLITTGEAKGELSIIDAHEQSFNRIVKIAQHQCGVEGYPHMLQLYEPQLLWMNEDRFVLTGFERIAQGNQTVDYAQSWLVKVERDNAM